MGLNETPRANRFHVAILGRRNAGKSSLLNAVSGQNAAIVSPVPGTTTDPVYRAMELHGAGPVVFIDTPGIDDVGDLGGERVLRTLKVLRKTDAAILVIDGTVGYGEPEKRVMTELKDRRIPVITVVNKIDVAQDGVLDEIYRECRGPIRVSASEQIGISAVVSAMADLVRKSASAADPPLIGDLLEPGDIVVLVVPVDIEAPKGRLILPQVQTIRDILDHDAVAVVSKTAQLAQTIGGLGRPPKLVVTDSQAFDEVSRIVPPEVPLTSFSILYARYKGDLEELSRGIRALKGLKPGDKVLIAEACTHHPVEDDIGKVKIPRWLEQKVGGNLEFGHVRGGDFPENLADYKVVVHCGACMLNRREMMSRIAVAESAGVPITNYGMTIAYVHGILERALQPFRVHGAHGPDSPPRQGPTP